MSVTSTTIHKMLTMAAVHFLPISRFNRNSIFIAIPVFTGGCAPSIDGSLNVGAVGPVPVVLESGHEKLSYGCNIDRNPQNTNDGRSPFFTNF